MGLAATGRYAALGLRGDDFAVRDGLPAAAARLATLGLRGVDRGPRPLRFFKIAGFGTGVKLDFIGVPIPAISAVSG